MFKACFAISLDRLQLCNGIKHRLRGEQDYEKVIKTAGILAALFFCWECAIDKLFDAETHNIPNLHI